MNVVKSTRNHKLHYAFPYFISWDYHAGGIAEFGRWVRHFESLYGKDMEHKMFDGRTFSTLTYNPRWRAENNRKAKRLRIYVKEAKDITWAQLNLT